MSGFLIQFNIPTGGVMFAGDAPDGSLGFAPLLAGARVYETREIAERFIENGYPQMKDVAEVIPYEQAGPDGLRKLFQF